MISKLDYQTLTSEFESHWEPHSFDPVPHRSKELCKLVLKPRVQSLSEHHTGLTTYAWVLPHPKLLTSAHLTSKIIACSYNNLNTAPDKNLFLFLNLIEFYICLSCIKKEILIKGFNFVNLIYAFLEGSLMVFNSKVVKWFLSTVYRTVLQKMLEYPMSYADGTRTERISLIFQI